MRGAPSISCRHFPPPLLPFLFLHSFLPLTEGPLMTRNTEWKIEQKFLGIFSRYILRTTRNEENRITERSKRRRRWNFFYYFCCCLLADGAYSFSTFRLLARNHHFVWSACLPLKFLHVILSPVRFPHLGPLPSLFTFSARGAQSFLP